MGTWGPGPLQSDAALDLGDDLNRHFRKCRNNPQSFIGSCFKKLDFAADFDSKEEAIIAAAAWFFVQGYDISKHLHVIDVAIDSLLLQNEDWCHPKRRVEVLNLFRDQIHGKCISKKKQKQYGLMSDGLMLDD